MDVKDRDVETCNTYIKQLTDEDERFFLAKQDRLRTPDKRHYYDVKHITQYAVPIFVASIKNALRAACGIEHRNQMQRGQGYDHQNRGVFGGYWHGGARGNDRGRGHVGRGGRGGRGGFNSRGRGSYAGHGGNGGRGRFDLSNELEKFKTEVLNLIAAQHAT